jgi:hypothetical protein
MTTTEERTDLGAVREDYDEICRVLREATGSVVLLDKFETMIGEVARHCYARAVAEALKGFVFTGEVAFADDFDLRLQLTVPAVEVTA